MAAPKRARSASADLSLDFLALSRPDAALFPQLSHHHHGVVTSGTTPFIPQSFKSARTDTNTSPTTNRHISDPRFAADLAYPTPDAAPGPVTSVDPTLSVDPQAFHFSSSVTHTPALSQSMSSDASHESPGNTGECSPLTLGAHQGTNGRQLYPDGAAMPPQSINIPASHSTKPTSSQPSSLTIQPSAWSSYHHTLSPNSFSPTARIPLSSSGSSYRGSMDDSLGLGAGYGVPNTALASLGLDGSSPLGPSPAIQSGLNPTSLSTYPPFSQVHFLAPTRLPPQQPLPATPGSQPLPTHKAATTTTTSTTSQSSPTHGSVFSPSAPGFRETRKGQDLGLDLEDFEVIETLGTGTFGRVLLCRLLRSPLQDVPQYFAMKVLKKVEVVRLKQIQHINSERTILSAVRQNGIVNLFCTFQDEKNLYLLMEFVQGGELFSHLRRAGRFSPDVSRFYAANILLTLDYLHKHDIIYIDLKPENLLLDHQGYLKITDFGFAKCVPDRTFTLCGTPEYLAPEIIQSTGHSKAADYWALGVLLFEMLCGYPCFWAENPLGIYEKILAGAVHFPDHVDPGARDLIRRLLSANLSKRLGNLKGGIKDIMDHPWFEGVDWDMVRRREITAPIIPKARSPGDCSHFEKYGVYSLDNLPAMARAAKKRAHMAAGTWREPSAQERELLRQKHAAEDLFAEYFTDF